MTRQSHAGEEKFLEDEADIRDKTGAKRSGKAAAEAEPDDEWFDHIDDYDDIPMFRSED